MRVAIVQFPGSNADWDALRSARDVMGWDAYLVFHKEADLRNPDAVIIPGGFSYGDYLRPGAIARFSPISEALLRFGQGGGPMLGICNGFQVLTELGLLPGALTRNAHLRFECRDIFLRREGHGAFTQAVLEGAVLRLPIAHADGRYQCDEETLAMLQKEGRVAFRYCDPSGSVTPDEQSNARANALPTNPNGSVDAIAGIYDATGRILGMMPHPERACEGALGGRQGHDDGLAIFKSLAYHVSGDTFLEADEAEVDAEEDELHAGDRTHEANEEA